MPRNFAHAIGTGCAIAALLATLLVILRCSDDTTASKSSEPERIQRLAPRPSAATPESRNKEPEPPAEPAISSLDTWPPAAVSKLKSDLKGLVRSETLTLTDQDFDQLTAIVGGFLTELHRHRSTLESTVKLEGEILSVRQPAFVDRGRELRNLFLDTWKDSFPGRHEEIYHAIGPTLETDYFFGWGQGEFHADIILDAYALPREELVIYLEDADPGPGNRLKLAYGTKGKYAGGSRTFSQISAANLERDMRLRNLSEAIAEHLASSRND